MDIEQTSHAQAADAELSDALESASAVAPDEDRRDRRQMRIQEYEDRSLDHSDPLVASVGALNADMLTTAQLLGICINQALANAGNTVETVRELAPVLNTFQNITRQIGRNAQFELQAAEGREELEYLKGKLTSMAGSVLSPTPPPRHIPAIGGTRRSTR